VAPPRFLPTCRADLEARIPQATVLALAVAGSGAVA